MLKIGLTGGIGCGKTTVSKLFEQLDAPIIDADVIYRKLTQPGEAAFIRIQACWGNVILNPEGNLNRAYLRHLVFSNPIEKQKLEAITHPLIFAAIQAQIDSLSSPYCLLSIPLLFETQMTQLTDRILVIDCPVETQLARIKQRDQLPEEQILAIINSQVSREFRIKHADDLLENTVSNDELAEQVKKLHNLYLSISHCQD